MMIPFQLLGYMWEILSLLLQSETGTRYLLGHPDVAFQESEWVIRELPVVRQDRGNDG